MASLKNLVRIFFAIFSVFCGLYLNPEIAVALTVLATKSSTTTTLTAQDFDADGYSLDGTIGGEKDCNDKDFMISPVGIEVGDSVDNDCDGTIDESSQSLNMLDATKATTTESFVDGLVQDGGITYALIDSPAFTPDHLTIALNMDSSFCSSDYQVIPTIQIRLMTPDANHGDGNYYYVLSDDIIARQTGSFCNQVFSVALPRFQSEFTPDAGSAFDAKTQKITQVRVAVDANRFHADDRPQFSVTHFELTGGLSRAKVLLLSTASKQAEDIAAVQAALPEAFVVTGNINNWLAKTPATSYAAGTSTVAETEYDYIVLDFRGAPKNLGPLAIETLTKKFTHGTDDVSEDTINAMVPYYPANAMTLRNWMQGGGNLVVLGPESMAGKYFLSVAGGYFSGQFNVTAGGDTSDATWRDNTICSNETATGIDAAAQTLCANLQKKIFSGKVLTPQYAFDWKSIVASSAGTVVGGERFSADSGWAVVSALSTTDLSFLSALELDRLDGHAEPDPAFTGSDDTGAMIAATSLYSPKKVFAKAGQFNGKPVLTIPANSVSGSKTSLSTLGSGVSKTLTLTKLSSPQSDSSIVLARFAFYADGSTRTENKSTLKVAVNGKTIATKVIEMVNDGRVVVVPVALSDVTGGSYAFTFTNKGERTLYVDAVQLETYHTGNDLLFGVNDSQYDEWSDMPKTSSDTARTPYDVAQEYFNLVRVSMNIYLYTWTELLFDDYFNSDPGYSTGINLMLSAIAEVSPDARTLVDFDEFRQWNGSAFVTQTLGGVPPTDWLGDQFVPAFFDHLPNSAGGDVCVVQFGGEYNVDFDFQFRGTMLDYANHLKAGFDAIQTINAERASTDACQIEVLSTAFIYPFGGHAYSITGAWEHMDAANIHLYHSRTRSFGQQVFEIQNAMHEYGKIKPIWAAETGLDYSWSESYADTDARNKRDIAEAIDAGLDRIWYFPFFGSNTQPYGLFASEDNAPFDALEPMLFWFDLGKNGAERIYPASIPSTVTSATYSAASVDDDGNVRFRGYTDDPTNVHVTLPIDSGYYRITINDGDTSCVEITDDFYEFDVAPYDNTVGEDGASEANDIKADFIKRQSCSNTQTFSR